MTDAVDRLSGLSSSAGASARWVRSGLALLTGDQTPVLPRRDVAGALEAITARAQEAVGRGGADLDLRLFCERGAELGLSRHGSVSANGAARMIAAADGWLAVNLARPDDIDLLPAWLGAETSGDPWTAIERAARRRTAADLTETGQALGLPVAPVGGWDVAGGTTGGARLEQMATGQGEPVRAPLVIDLSSLWAGPLCAHILGLAGARVIKVESAGRPDAARSGPRAFFDRLHAGHEAVMLDFATREGRGQLSRLLARADVVIEGTRPRAFEQLGIEIGAAFEANPALVWVSLTAYGRTAPWRNRVGFGDDAAAAGGLVVRAGDGRPMFIGDALADPIAGVLAATEALAALARGGGVLVDMALREAAALVAAAAPVPDDEIGEVHGGEGGWRWFGDGAALSPPTARPEAAAAASAGRHTAAVLAELT